MDANGVWQGLMNNSTRILIIGAGSRGHGYARAVCESTSAKVAAIAEPIAFKRAAFGRKYIWGDTTADSLSPGQQFSSWQDFLHYETRRREAAAAGEKVEPGVDAAFVCVLDEQHAEVLTALAPLNLHIMSEKPLATTLDDCLDIYSSLLPEGPEIPPKSIFGICHVLRYSPHNMMLRKLLLGDRAIGDVISIQHTEPVGWWHFSHSYVRGNWRKESTTAPSLLTKSCHDIDLLLWLLGSPLDAASKQRPHLPSTVSSAGHLSYFRRQRKPKAAGPVTNCLQCPVESKCKYSAKKIYVEKHLRKGEADWPVKIVNPEIEDCLHTQGEAAAERKLLDSLAEDYTTETPQAEIDRRPWFGRCVWNCDNDVSDDQSVTMTWDDEPGDDGSDILASGRSRKTAIFHMIAHTEAQCERRGIIYGTDGEITYDSRTIKVYSFETGETAVYQPKQMPGGHGGGDDGLVRQFMAAVEAVRHGKMTVEDAQREHIGATLEDVVRSHAMVFAAEEARKQAKVVVWNDWWTREVEKRLTERKGWHVVSRR